MIQRTALIATVLAGSTTIAPAQDVARWTVEVGHRYQVRPDIT